MKSVNVWLPALMVSVCGAPVIAQNVEGRDLAAALVDTCGGLWAGEYEVSYRRWFGSGELIGAYSVAFDRTMNRLYVKTATEKPAAETFWVIDDGKSRFVYESSLHTVSKLSTGGEVVGRDKIPFDVRNVGLVNCGEWDRRITFDTQREFLLKPSHQIIARNDSGNERVILEWRGTADASTGEVWMRRVIIDRSRSSLPVEMLEGLAKKTASDSRGTGDRQREDMTVYHSSKFEWTKVGTAWAPAQWTFEEVSGKQGGEYNFVWRTANSPLNADLFNLDRLPLPSPTHVINNVLAEAFVEDVIRDMDDSGKSIGAVSLTSRWSRWFLVGNVVSVILLAAAIIYRRRNRKQLS